MIFAVRNVKTINQAISLMSPNGNDTVSVDEMFMELRNIGGLSNEEKLVLTFIPIDQYQIEKLQIDLKSFI